VISLTACQLGPLLALSGRQLPARDRSAIGDKADVTERRTDVTSQAKKNDFHRSLGGVNLAELAAVAAYVWAMGMQQHALWS
jgi:hypothetical protein